MSHNPIHDVHKYGQSIWYDYLRRGLLSLGKLKRMIEAGEISGVTSNPTILDKAIAESNDYDLALQTLLTRNPQLAVSELYETLVLEDIRTVAAFAQSFRHLMDSLAKKREEIVIRLHSGAAPAARGHADVRRPG